MGKIISIVALLAVSVATFVMYTQPTYDHVTEVKTKISRLDEALSKTRNIREIRESLSSRFAEFTQDDLSRLQKMLPDHVDNIRLVLDMDGIASQYGMRLQNVVVQEGETISQNNKQATALGSSNSGDTMFQSIVIQFNVEATYDEFIQFLGDLESSLRIVDLVAMSMDPVEKKASAIGDNTSDSAQRYQFSLALKTYWLK